MTLGGFLDRLASSFGSREALAWAPRAEVVRRLRYDELRAESLLFARRLLSLGVRKGTHVGFLCTNRTEWLPFAFGVFRLGAVLVPLSTLWKAGEIAYALGHADVEVLVLVSRFRRHDYVEALRGAERLEPGVLARLRAVAVLDGEPGGIVPWERIVPADESLLRAAEGEVSPADPATIFFTSGTTAQAKAVVHRHEALVLSAERIAGAFGIGGQDAWWGHMPLFWSGGFVLGALATLAGGGRVVLHEHVEPGEALRLLEAERCTVMAGWHQAGPLLEHPDFPHRRLFLRKGTYHPLAERLLGPDHLAVGVYGMSETATCVSASRWDDPREVRVETFGRPFDGMEVRIVDPDSRRTLPAGETGEILVKGPTLMEGYYKVPRSETFDAEGFFATGDLGHFDDRGYLHFEGRRKDVIKTAGVNVAAAEVEATLERHPAVKSAHVVGVSHPVRGENVAAFVVLAPGRGTTPEELEAFCRAELASYKVPRHFFFVGENEVPKTATGKVEKRALREAAEKRLGESETPG
ncbi:MAG: AMP-binding protein [Candidatus Binatia bacterium]|nr:MAG: AMP-binding protein [Candidatus Binatia bacterium]